MVRRWALTPEQTGFDPLHSYFEVVTRCKDQPVQNG